jgi:hypothetical protein
MALKLGLYANEMKADSRHQKLNSRGEQQSMRVWNYTVNLDMMKELTTHNKKL